MWMDELSSLSNEDEVPCKDRDKAVDEPTVSTRVSNDIMLTESYKERPIRWSKSRCSSNVAKLLSLRETCPRNPGARRRFWGRERERGQQVVAGMLAVDAHEALQRWAETDSLRHFSAQYCPLHPAPRSTIAAAFSTDGACLASTHGDHTVKILSCETGECLKTLSGHRRTPWVVRFHPRVPHVVASGSLDHDVRLWDASTANCIAYRDFYRPIASLAFHASGDLLAVASGHKLYIWQYTRDGEGDGGRPWIVLKTRRSLRAVHFHPHGVPLLLTAEVSDLESSDCPANMAMSSGYPHYPPPSIHFTPAATAAAVRSVAAAPHAAASLFPFPHWPSWFWPSLASSVAGAAASGTLQAAAPFLTEGRGVGEEREGGVAAAAAVEVAEEEMAGWSGAAEPMDVSPQRSRGVWTRARGAVGRRGGEGEEAGRRGEVRGTEVRAEQSSGMEEDGRGVERGAGDVRGGRELGPVEEEGRAMLDEMMERGVVADGREGNDAGSDGVSRDAEGTSRGVEGGGVFGEGLEVDDASHGLFPRRNAMSEVQLAAMFSSSSSAAAAGADRAVGREGGYTEGTAGMVEGGGLGWEIPFLQGWVNSGVAGGVGGGVAAGDSSLLTEQHTTELDGDYSMAESAERRVGNMEQGAGREEEGSVQPSSSVSVASVAMAAAMAAARAAARAGAGMVGAAGAGLGAGIGAQIGAGAALGVSMRFGGSGGGADAAGLLHFPPPRGAAMEASLAQLQVLMSGEQQLPQQMPFAVHQQQQQQQQRQLQQPQQQQPQQQQQQGPQPEVPCTVKLRIWQHDLKRPTAELQPEDCCLTIPHAVLCSEMGAHFSPCGRYLAACVACVPPTAANVQLAASSHGPSGSLPHSGRQHHSHQQQQVHPNPNSSIGNTVEQQQQQQGQRQQSSGERPSLPAVDPVNVERRHGGAEGRGVGDGATGSGNGGGMRKGAATAATDIIYELRIYSLEQSTFGQVLASRAVRAAHCLTSIQFSPSSCHLLLAYGRRHSSLLRSLVADGTSIIPVYTILEVYRVSDMSLVSVLPSAEDEVNVASFHPSVGGGLVYGTKEGKLRMLLHDKSLQSHSTNNYLGERML